MYVSDTANTAAKLIYLATREIVVKIAATVLLELNRGPASSEADLVKVVPVFDFFPVIIDEVAVCFVEPRVNYLRAGTNASDTRLQRAQ